YSAAVYSDDISNAALTISGAEGLFPSGDVLPDLFTTSSVFNAGSYRSVGYMASVTQNLGENLKVTAMYASGNALLADKAEISSQSPDDLRSMIRHDARRRVRRKLPGHRRGA